MTPNYDWRQDRQFCEWNNQLYEKKFTFDEVLAFTGIDKWVFVSNDWKTKATKVYNDLCTRWNRNSAPQYKSDDATKIIGFAAIVLCYCSVPYDLLNTKFSSVTELMATMINRVYFYEYYIRVSIPPETKIPCDVFALPNPERLDMGPIHPSAYREWIDEKYNRASWWLSFWIYEKNFRSDKPPVFPSEIAKFR